MIIPIPICKYLMISSPYLNFNLRWTKVKPTKSIKGTVAGYNDQLLLKSPLKR